MLPQHSLLSLQRPSSRVSEWGSVGHPHLARSLCPSGSAVESAAGLRGGLVECSRRKTFAVRCMAHPVRVAKVAKQIEREMGNAFVRDKVLLKALRPAFYEIGMDPIVTVVNVDVSGDLQVAKVYLSLYNVDDDDVPTTWERLFKLQPYLRKILGERLRLKHTPEVRLILDKEFASMHRAFDLLENLRNEEEKDANAQHRVDSEPHTDPDRFGVGVDGGISDDYIDADNIGNDKEDDIHESESEFSDTVGSRPPATLAFADLFGNEPKRRKPKFRAHRKLNR